MSHVNLSTNFDTTRPDTAAATVPTVLFVGDGVRFSDRMLTVLNAEFPGYRFARVATCADVAVARRMNEIVHVFFDESFIAEIREDPARFDAAAGPARIGIAYCDSHLAAAFMKEMPALGAHDDVGFLPIDARIDVWLSVMRLLLCGQVFVPHAFLEEADPVRRAPPQGLSVDVELTPREWQVLDWVAKGSPNKIIAAELDLSEHTIKLHIHNMLRKIGVTNRTGAANWYAQCQRAVRGGVMQ